jgi:putative Holliday junction resolvase
MAEGRPQIILAFDYGTRRLGVATGDTITRTARALTTLEYTAGKLPWNAIDKLASDFTPAQFVVGLPYNIDGSPTSLTSASRRFATRLKSRYAAAVALIDERYSSLDGEAALRAARATGARRRRVGHADVDSAAAVILIERWFENPTAAENA